MDFFSGDYISALTGCCALKFSHVLEIHQFLLVHTPSGAGVPSNKFLSRKFKICPKIQRVRRNNFRASESILTGLFQSTSREAGVIIWAQFLQCPPPKICDGKKMVENFARFLTSFDFDRVYLRNGSTYQKSETLLKIYNHYHVGGKKVCVLRSTNDRVYSPNTFTP